MDATGPARTILALLAGGIAAGLAMGILLALLAGPGADGDAATPGQAVGMGLAFSIFTVPAALGLGYPSLLLLRRLNALNLLTFVASGALLAVASALVLLSAAARSLPHAMGLQPIVWLGGSGAIGALVAGLLLPRQRKTAAKEG